MGRREWLTFVDLVENGDEMKIWLYLDLVENNIEMERCHDDLVENGNEMVIGWHAFGMDAGNVSETGKCVDL